MKENKNWRYRLYELVDVVDETGDRKQYICEHNSFK